jgi:hypothetical protein
MFHKNRINFDCCGECGKNQRLMVEKCNECIASKGKIVMCSCCKMHVIRDFSCDDCPVVWCSKECKESVEHDHRDCMFFSECTKLRKRLKWL